MTSFTAILLLAFAATNPGDGGMPSAGATQPASREGQPPVAGAHFPGATAALKCTFDATRDEDLYGWPPGWTRRHGPGYPRYVHVRVDDERPPPGGRSLRVELNGGAASAFGPSLAITPGVDYVLEGYVKTAALRNDSAWITLTFLDSARLKLSEASSEKVSGTAPWQKVSIGRMVPPARTAQLIVGIHVAPQGNQQDLRGAASFGSLWVGQLPRVILTARSAASGPQVAEANAAASSPPATRGASDVSFLVFPRGKPIELACLVSGFAAPQYAVQLELEDAAGHKLAEHRESFAAAAQPLASTKTDGPTETAPKLVTNSARATWQIAGDAAGYYRVRARVVPIPAHPATRSTADRLSVAKADIVSCAPQAELGLAIIDPGLPNSQSEFGWSLEPADVALGLVPMGDLLTQSGIHWVKFPFVCSLVKQPTSQPNRGGTRPNSKPSQPDRVEPLINFTDRLADAGVRMVGVLYPPAASAELGLPPCNLLAIETFAADANTWYPSIEPILGRLGTEVRFWQIGDDRDPGWIGGRDLPAAVSRVKAALDRVGQDVNVGIPWNLDAPLPLDGPSAAMASNNRGPAAFALDRPNPKTEPKREAPWRFLSLPCDDVTTDADLAARLDESASAGVERWLTIEPLPRAVNGSQDRIAHLVGRMITAKMHGAEGIFLAHPFDAERGLVGRDGSPNELFLPWRTTALMLGGLPYAGDIDLAGGSRIHCFGDLGKYVGVVADDAPHRETIYLGDDLQSCDLCGHILDQRPTANAAAGPGPATQSTDRPAGPSCKLSIIPVERLPVFLTGLDSRLIQWQLNVAFAPKSLLSVPNSAATVVLQMNNPLPTAVSVRVRIAGPRNWQIDPDAAEFHIDANDSYKLPLKVALPNDVVGGRQMIALDFEIQADRLYRFTMYRPVEITLGDVSFDGHAALADDGSLEVRQMLINQSKRAVSFRCSLSVPDRRRQSTDVLLAPLAKSEYAYRLADGRELLGKSLWLRAEEIDGPRVLNFCLKPSSR